MFCTMILPGESDLLAERGGIFDHIQSQYRRRSTVRLEQRREHADERGLAGAVGPEQTENRAAPDVEIDAGERLHVAERLDDARDGDRWILSRHGPDTARSDSAARRRLA
jgi:hypothetical protein